MAKPQPLQLPCTCLVHQTSDGAMALTPKCDSHTKNPAALARSVTDWGIKPRCAPAPGCPQEPCAFSYSGNPKTSRRDEVRFLLGDTNGQSPYLKNGEIEWLLEDANFDPLSAAIRGCETIIAKLSGLRDESVGSVSIRFSQSATGFMGLLKTLKMRMGKRALPFAGGIDRTQKLLNELDPTRVRPAFTRQMMERYPHADTSGTAMPYGWGACFYRRFNPAWGGNGIYFPDCGIGLAQIDAGVTDTGQRILSGVVDPTADTPGLPGDFYYNVITHTLFGPYPGQVPVFGQSPQPSPAPPCGDNDDDGCPCCGQPCGSCPCCPNAPTTTTTEAGDRILLGTTDPTDQTPGEPGDYFYNQTTHQLFGPYPDTAATGSISPGNSSCTLGSAGTSAQLPAGVTDSGERILTGTADPTDQTPGVAGEYYMNESTHTVFGPYTSPS